MKHRHFSKATVCVVLCFCTAISSIFCLNGTSSVSAADKSQLSQLQQQSQEIENQQKQIDEKLEQARKDIENQEKLKETLEEKITSVEKQIDNLNKTVEEYNKQINRLQSGIYEKEAAIDDDYQKLRQRLRIIYMAGDASNLEIILGAKSFDDFIDKMDLVKCLGEADEKLISGLQDSIADINSDKEKLEKELADMVKTAEIKANSMKAAAEDSVARQQLLYDKLKMEMSAFKAAVSAKYKEHLEMLKALPDVAPMDPKRIAEVVSAAVDKAPNPESFIKTADLTAPVYTEKEISVPASKPDSGFTVADEAPEEETEE